MFKGHLWKDGRYWLVEVLSLDIVTQGRSKKDALFMIKDAIEMHLGKKVVHVKVIPSGKSSFYVTASDVRPLVALMLKRQRAKSNLSLEDMRKRLHAKSRSQYAAYERGIHLPAIDKIEHILRVMGIRGLSINIIAKDEITESTRLHG